MDRIITTTVLRLLHDDEYDARISSWCFCRFNAHLALGLYRSGV